MHDKQRPQWPQIWVDFAKLISTRSTDPRLQVGAVIVAVDNTSVLAIGYNGDEKGGSNNPASLEPGQSGFIHAEINSLLKCDFSFHKKKIMYVTHFPCPVCSRAIVNSDISRVVYDDVYRDMAGREILDRSGIEVFQVQDLLHT